MDFNRDGDWADSGEQIFSDKLLAHGVNSLNYNVPSGASPGLTFARFRLGGEMGISFTGVGFGGEVEDYQITIHPPALATAGKHLQPHWGRHLQLRLKLPLLSLLRSLL